MSTEDALWISTRPGRHSLRAEIMDAIDEMRRLDQDGKPLAAVALARAAASLANELYSEASAAARRIKARHPETR